ncbi:MAG: autotransporter domain-containing protein [Treponema sp.]|jgi:hypothetical protein|nr:autotransporter domain-containing protein [Treponema sp.]
MKKQAVLISLAILSPVFALSAFGADFSISAGGGGLAGGLFTRYTLDARGKLVDISSAQRVDQFNYGGFVFVDATWVELAMGLQGGTYTLRESTSLKSGSVPISESSARHTGMETMLGLSLLGKYPFRLNTRLTLFPLAGLEYQIALREYRKPEVGSLYDRTDGIRESDKNGNAYSLSAWNSLLVDIGAGLDIARYSGLFLRVELVYGFRLPTPFETDNLEKVKKMAGAPDPRLGGLTSGPVLKIALAYRFFR